MRPEVARAILTLVLLVALEATLIWIFPSGWLGTSLAWGVTIVYALRSGTRLPKFRRASKRVGPPLEWID